MRFLPFLFPRDDRFFVLLKESGENLHRTSQALVDLVESYEDVPRKVAVIGDLEEAGDRIIHEIMRNLHRSFVTPIDREDIAALGESLDDVVDAIEESARIMLEYGIDTPGPRAIELSILIDRCGVVLEHALNKLLHARGSRLRDILEDAVEINRLENEADQVTSRAVGELFANGTSAIEILKRRELYDHLEAATDRCEDAANVLEGIVLKNA
jgi:predicted phosphate transport protein (TIGR00153 family)